MKRYHPVQIDRMLKFSLGKTAVEGWQFYRSCSHSSELRYKVYYSRTLVGLLFATPTSYKECIKCREIREMGRYEGKYGVSASFCKNCATKLT